MPLIFRTMLGWPKWIAVAVTCLVCQTARCEVTAQQRARIDAIQADLREAANFFKQKDFSQSAKKITAVEESLAKLLAGKDAAVARSAKPIYASVQRAHALLELEGMELRALPSWEQLTGAPIPAGESGSLGAVSFKNDIAPIILSQCASCHIDNKRGQFSMSSFADLMRGGPSGPVVVPRDAKGSRLVELVQSGDMPRGSGKVSPENLNKLRGWVDAGAKFDGADQQAALRSYSKAMAAPTAPARTAIAAPSGKETVRFSTDVAPILLENCGGCHIGSRRPGGNLNMDNFAAMWRGGDSEAPISPGNADESLLIKKVKGIAGQRMPAGGRPPLSAEKIELIATWVREGATFDGKSQDLDIKTVAEQGWAATAQHAELFARRRQRALERWHKVLPNAEPSIRESNELLLLGNVTDARMDELLNMAEKSIESAKKLLKVPAQDRFLRGGLTIFAFKGKYDYSEFGRMTENRQLFGDWRGHWRTSTIDAYGALVDDRTEGDEQTTKLLLRICAGAYLGSFAQTPEWFAEGVARNLVAGAAGRKDPQVLAWQRALATAAQKIDKAQTLLDGALDDETAALIGMGITNSMMDRANRKRFDAFLNALRGGQTFSGAVTAAYASPEQLIKSWLGK